MKNKVATWLLRLRTKQIPAWTDFHFESLDNFSEGSFSSSGKCIPMQRKNKRSGRKLDDKFKLRAIVDWFIFSKTITQNTLLLRQIMKAPFRHACVDF